MTDARALELPQLGRDEVRVYTLDHGDSTHVRRITQQILAAFMCVGVDEIRIETAEKGKPYLANDRGLHFSVSHSHNVSMIALTRVAAVGVDVEQVRAVPNAEAILKRFFAPEQLASILTDDNRDLRFVEAWTRAEATVKVRGASVWEAATPDPNVSICALSAPDGFAAAVAIACRDNWRVVQLDMVASDWLDV